MNTSSPRRHPRGDVRMSALFALLPVVAAILAAAPAAQAADTSLSNVPLATATITAKPNLLFVLDASGSMNWSYMPDDLGASVSTTDQPNDTWYGYYSSQCNGVAYDPVTVYTPPIKYDGTSYPDSNVSSAYNNGYNTASGTTDLTSKFYYTYNTAVGTQKPMAWAYTTAGVINNTFFQECSSTIPTASVAGSSPGVNVFTRVNVADLDSTGKKNYANWFSYYSHRYQLMRTSMGQAIAGLDNNYRVGFAIIQDSTPRLDVKDFTAGSGNQKDLFYQKLYGADPNGGTPLPNALAMAGRYYAKALPSQAYDPVQYACQRNYTLLSTDGYWNDNSKDYDKSGSRVGDQDGSELPPMKDGNGDTSSSVSTDYTATESRGYFQSSGSQTRTITWTRSVNVVPSPGTGTSHTTSSCNAPGYSIVSSNATATETQVLRYERVKTRQNTKTRTVVTNSHGQVLSDTWTSPTVGSWSAYTYVNHMTDNGAGDYSDLTTLIDPGTYSGGTVTSCVPTASAPPIGTDTHSTPAAFPTAATAVSYPTSPTSDIVSDYSAGTPQPAVAGTLGSVSDTLADVAEYYWKTDLRPSSSCGTGATDVCSNVVIPTTADPATWQHMNTFTIGLGASGTLPFTNDYLTDTSASATYPKLKSGYLDWPDPGTSGQGNPANIDDLWHAAVNGRGQYYSALNTSLLNKAITSVVNQVKATAGSGAAAATSSLALVTGDNNQIFSASYTTANWVGDLQAYGINAATAAIDTTPKWTSSAAVQLDGVADPTTRKIYFNGGAAGLQTFTYDNLTTAGRNTYFDNICGHSPAPTQCAGLNSDDTTAANLGANLVGYLIGKRTFESAGATLPGGKTSQAVIYRSRLHLLGDIVGGSPVFVGKPPFAYGDAGYADFVSSKASRKRVVYVAANDGMLHAFSDDTSDGGAELWAYVPTMVMPNMYKLADTGYATAHQYFVDGAPVMGDVQDADGHWHTILVGGLNAGGKGYYALDITDPTSPSLLWEFTDTNLGYTFGNPLITKRHDGTWVVVFASGYNNTSGGGDGNGHLFVVPVFGTATTAAGTKVVDITTDSVGSSSAPSGLAKINGWVEDVSNNTTLRYYGGDLLGNVWRFDIDGLVDPKNGAQKLASLTDPGGHPQPITARPELFAVGDRSAVVIGTGQYLGSGDVNTTQTESIYAIADTMTNTGWGVARTNTKFVQQTFTLSGDLKSATISDTAVNLKDVTVGGWFVDLPHAGERVFNNMSIQYSTLAIGTGIPSGDACTSGGSSWRYFLNVNNGGVIDSSTVAGVLWQDKSLISGMSWVKDTNGDVKIITQDSNSAVQEDTPPIAMSTGPGAAHRTSWRELSN